MKNQYRKIRFEYYLNENSNIDEDSEEWVIGGVYKDHGKKKVVRFSFKEV